MDPNAEDNVIIFNEKDRGMQTFCLKKAGKVLQKGFRASSINNHKQKLKHLKNGKEDQTQRKSYLRDQEKEGQNENCQMSS